MYVSKAQTGDATLIARVTTMTSTVYSARAGVMFRDGLATNAPNVMLTMYSTGEVALQSRATVAGETTSTARVGGAGAKWLRLVRTGNTFTAAYATTTGTPAATDWITVGSVTVTMTTPRLGLAVNAADAFGINRATFVSVSVNGGLVAGDRWHIADDERRNSAG
jgi:hypothetical protein